MTITMNISHITTLPEIQKFLKTARQLKPEKPVGKAATYEWLSNLLAQLRYHKLLKKKHKKTVKDFIQYVTGYNCGHIKRLIARHKEGKLTWIKWQKGTLHRVYTHADISLLHKTDKVHQLAGSATKLILQREYKVFGRKEYRKLANISPSHIYNLRNSRSYLYLGRIFTKTKPTTVQIGIRKKPEPNGEPGYLRVDSVHQGDLGKTKSVYFINVIDEVTQIEFVFCVARITEKHLIPVLKLLAKICPLKIIGFHSDNGSEYINQYVAEQLNKLHVEQTKSRPRKSNDNALAETKNGSIIRKEFGYYYIPATAHNVRLINQFCLNWLNPYLMYHRPCGYASVELDKRGKQKKRYKLENYKTPYEKLKSLPKASQYLKSGVSFKKLDRQAYAQSDTEYATTMREAKAKMLKRLKLKRTG